MKTNKKAFVILGFLACGTCVPSSLVQAKKSVEKSESADKNDKILFSSVYIRFVDGTQFIDIGQMLNFARHMLAILNGAPIKIIKKLQKEYSLTLQHPFETHISENEKTGFIWFDGSYRTLKWLREYEKNSPKTPEYKEALTQACNHFIQFSADYVVEIETAKGIMVKIINEWSELRNKPNTLLLDWSNLEGAERDDLFKTMTSFEVFDIFLCDLLLFLKDLVHNCPKSYQKYQEQMKQSHNGPKRTN